MDEARYREEAYELLPPKYTIVVRDVEKGFGTALAAICFTSYINPIIPIAGKLGHDLLQSTQN